MKKHEIKQLIREEVQRALKEGLGESSIRKIQEWIDELDYRGAALKLIDTIISRRYMGMTSSDFEDSSTLANGLDTIEDFLISGTANNNREGDFDNAFETAKETVRDMAEDMGEGEGEWISY